MGGAALIRVGGTTDPEVRERKLRLEDALFATRAAIAEGIVPGGGVALLRAAAVLAKPVKDLSEDERAGVAIVRRVCEEPCRQIVVNAGQDPSEVLGRIRRKKGAHGYNAARNVFENLIDAGVVDPTMVVRLALQNAASIAGLLLSSEALIADAPRDPVDFPTDGGPQDAQSVEPILVKPRPPPDGRQVDLIRRSAKRSVGGAGGDPVEDRRALGGRRGRRCSASRRRREASRRWRSPGTCC